MQNSFPSATPALANEFQGDFGLITRTISPPKSSHRERLSVPDSQISDFPSSPESIWSYPAVQTPNVPIDPFSPRALFSQVQKFVLHRKETESSSSDSL